MKKRNESKKNQLKERNQKKDRQKEKNERQTERKCHKEDKVSPKRAKRSSSLSIRSQILLILHMALSSLPVQHSIQFKSNKFTRVDC